MKLHLPVTLLHALLAATCLPYAYAALSVPEGYTEVVINSAEDFAAFLPEEATDYMFTVANGVTLTTGPEGTLLSGGNVIVQAEGTLVLEGSAEGNSSLFTGDSLVLSGNLDIRNWKHTQLKTHRDALGAISATQLTIQNNAADIHFSNCSAYGSGAVISAGENGSVTLVGNTGSISFENNTAVSPDTKAGRGAAIYLDSGAQLDVRDNSSISFIGNAAKKEGGAIYASTLATNRASISFSNNGRIVFSDNSSSSTGGDGGAIYGGLVSFTDNQEILFSGNSANTSTSVGGGAIYISGGGTTNGQEYRGTCTFTGNEKVVFSGNRADKGTAYGGGPGGAIYISSTLTSTNKADLTLSQNGEVSFAQNTSLRNGGAIAAQYTTIRMESNQFLSFENNRSKGYGAAIYASSLKIAGNQEVIFRGNYEENRNQLRSLYIAGNVNNKEDVLSLSAASGGHITFYDSVYAGNLDAAISLNEEGSGDIIFSGQHVREDLASMTGSEATNAQITGSLTNELLAHTTLHSGRLEVRDEAILKTGSLTIGSNGNTATLLLNQGTVNLNASVSGQTSHDLTFSAGSALELAGANNMTVKNLNAAAGSTWSFTLSEINSDSALLSFSGSLKAVDLTIRLLGTESLNGRQLTLLSGAKAEEWAGVTWDGVDTSNLFWQGNTLYLDLTSQPLPSDTVITTTQDLAASDLTAPTNVIVRQDGQLTLFGSIQAAPSGSELEGLANGNLIIEQGSAVIAEGGEVKGHVIFRGREESQRRLEIEREGFHVSTVELATTAGSNSLSVAGGHTATVDQISGEGSLVKQGDGTLASGGDWALQGQLAVQEGTVKITAGLSLGSEAGIAVSKGGVLDLRGAATREGAWDWRLLNQITGAAPEDVGTVLLASTPDNAHLEVNSTDLVDLNARYEVEGDLRLNAWKTGASGRNKLTTKWQVSGGLKVTKQLQLTTGMGLIIKDKAEVSAGSLVLGHREGNNPGSLEMQGGTLTTGTITLHSNSANVLSITGGTVHFTQEQVFADSENDGSVTITDAQLEGDRWILSHDLSLGKTVIKATQSATIGQEGDTVTLTGTLTNAGAAGSVALGGAWVTESLDCLDREAGHTFSEGINGYRQDYYYILRQQGQQDIAAVALAETGVASVQQMPEFLTVGGQQMAMQAGADGSVYVATPTYGDYYVNGEEVYASDRTIASEQTTNIILNGGRLTLQQGLDDGKQLRAITDSGLVLESGVTLASAALARENGATTTLEGSGTYTLGKSLDMKGVKLGPGWNGTVHIGDTGKLIEENLDLSLYGTASSTIVLQQLDGSLADKMNVTSDIQLHGMKEAAIALKSGKNQATYTFSGRVSSSPEASNANFVIDSHLEQSLNFTGDVSDWQGLLQGTNDNYDSGNGTGTTNLTFCAGENAESADIGASIHAALGHTVNLFLTTSGRDVTLLKEVANTSFWNKNDYGILHIHVATANQTTTFSQGFQADSLNIENGATVRIGSGSQAISLTARTAGQKASLTNITATLTELRAQKDTVQATMENASAALASGGTISGMALINSSISIAAGQEAHLQNLTLDANSSLISASTGAQLEGNTRLELPGIPTIVDDYLKLTSSQLQGTTLTSGSKLTLDLTYTPTAAGQLDILLSGFNWQDLTNGASMEGSDPRLGSSFQLELSTVNGLQTLTANSAQMTDQGLHLGFSVVPEPSTATLTLLSLLALMHRGRMRRR